MNKLLRSILLLVTTGSILVACEERGAERADASTEPSDASDADAETCDGGEACARTWFCPKAYSTDDTWFIDPKRVCDGVADCRRAQDETDCPELDNLFCDSDDEGGRTVYHPEHACDGHAECFRAEDERDCPNSFLCPIYQVGGGSSALPKSKVCDGVWDCTIDEFDCPDVSDPFVCPNGKTIDRKFMCDQGNDCSLFAGGGEHGSADEIDPSCHQYACESDSSDSPPRRTCSGCKPLVIHESKRCDGVRDCEKGDDERDCPEPFACSGGLFVRSRARCDGKPDCPQGDDEQGCP